MFIRVQYIIRQRCKNFVTYKVNTLAKEEQTDTHTDKDYFVNLYQELSTDL